jgi:hypothetical protein
MAIHLIISGLLNILDSSFLSAFLRFSVQLLNFAVLLSYPINFFIYCRMSRAFRDAFTKLLCPSLNESRQDGVQQSMPTQFVAKSYVNNNNQPTHLPVNDANIELKDSDIKVLPSSTVILNEAPGETSLPSLLNDTSHHETSYGNKNLINSLNKARIPFHDDVHKTRHNKHTDL